MQTRTYAFIKCRVATLHLTQVLVFIYYKSTSDRKNCTHGILNIVINSTSENVNQQYKYYIAQGHKLFPLFSLSIHDIKKCLRRSQNLYFNSRIDLLQESFLRNMTNLYLRFIYNRCYYSSVWIKMKSGKDFSL